MNKGNLFEAIPADLEKEVFEVLIENDNIRIERIISNGHTSPESGWYDQEQNEWVTVLKGEAVLEFEEGESLHLGKGDYLEIPSRKRHKVSRTSSEHETIWLAVHYR
ncbi:MAG: cupin domain-containing protein [Gammaproteobacteria bacterium]|nr:cupin domain-containing protein [Gammaproteobacteria bacterium]HXK55316.1 cupin domain-containing protein [Gammaproteobacteria bacterium]